ncbi:MAG: hypothetical protein ACJ746_03550 [Bryobacteraceae bacterium]
MKRNYHTIDNHGKVGERKLIEFLVRNGQALLPMMELIEHSRMVIDELIDVMGRASIEAVLELSAAQMAGPPQQGKARAADLVWAWNASGPRVSEGAQAQSEPAAALAKQGSRREQRGSGPGLPGHAAEQRHRRTQAGNPVEWRVHAALRQSHSRNGRHGGCVALDSQPRNHRSFRSR